MVLVPCPISVLEVNTSILPSAVALTDAIDDRNVSLYFKGEGERERKSLEFWSFFLAFGRGGLFPPAFYFLGN